MALNIGGEVTCWSKCPQGRWWPAANNDDNDGDDNDGNDNDGDDNDGDWAPLPCQSKALGPLLQETSTPPQEAPISPYYQQHVIQSSGSLFEFDSKLE